MKSVQVLGLYLFIKGGVKNTFNNKDGTIGSLAGGALIPIGV